MGIDIPNASVMLIENADRFGLSQLHQLRGRIGRGGYESYCILLADPKTDAAAERLKTIEGTLDGFEIAEADMDLHWPGTQRLNLQSNESGQAERSILSGVKT